MDLFFANFDEILARNDVKAAQIVAQRIKFLALPLGEERPHQLKPSILIPIPIQISSFHQKVIDRLNKDDTAAGAAMRKELAYFYFNPNVFIPHNLTISDWGSFKSKKKKEMNWLSEPEMEKIGESKFSKVYYYHATSLQALEDILRTGHIKAQKATYFGAFVAIGKPFVGPYGEFALAFNKNIERNSFVSSRAGPDEAGFIRDIPVNSETLNYIVIAGGIDFNQRYTEIVKGDLIARKNMFREWLQTKCEGWAGREIPVLYHSEAHPYMGRVRNMNLGIPKEWGNAYYENVLPSSECLPWGKSYYGNIRPDSEPILSRSALLPSRL